MIKLENVSAGYGQELILKDISANFPKGTLTSIIGVNGSGKSTLLKSILGFLPLQTGTIIIDDQVFSSLTPKERANKAAYLSQGKNTPDMTVEQLVLHGRFPHLCYPRRYTKQDREIAALSMEQVGISAIAEKPLTQLSGGMRQKAYIAMALAQDTDYILLDEPTTYLDIKHQLELMKLLRALADSGKGVLTVMHDLPMAFTYSDCILLLDQGKICIHDTPWQVYKHSCLKDIFGVSLESSNETTSYHYNYESGSII